MLAATFTVYLVLCWLVPGLGAHYITYDGFRLGQQTSMERYQCWVVGAVAVRDGRAGLLPGHFWASLLVSSVALAWAGEQALWTVLLVGALLDTWFLLFFVTYCLHGYLFEVVILVGYPICHAMVRCWCSLPRARQTSCELVRDFLLPHSEVTMKSPCSEDPSCYTPRAGGLVLPWFPVGGGVRLGATQGAGPRII